MKSTMLKQLALAAVLAAGLTTPARAAPADDDAILFLGHANARVAKAMAFRSQWEGPISAPKVTKKALLVFIGADFRDGAVNGVSAGVREAAAVIGWNVQFIDCYGMAARRAEAFSRALALKPAGIVLAGIDARDAAKELAAAAAAKVPLVGWHASAQIGPGADGLFTNIGTDPREAGQLAALLGVVESKGKAGVVILADNSNAYNAARSAAIADTIRTCKACALLGIADMAARPDLGALRKQFGKRLTHAIAAGDQFIDPLAGPLVKTALAGDVLPAIGAGDGLPGAYQRIRSHTVQLGTVPEPLHLQGWQLVDEIVRADAGSPPSGFATPAYLVTAENAAFHGGPKDGFDPANNYRSEYRRLWGK
ncbi:MAG: substrate-binding domain-containing protein [Betaproteobacteria bacterium]